MIAITRQVSSNLGQCDLTFMERAPIDFSLATRQHNAYCDCLRQVGLDVVSLPALQDRPDCCFVEDNAVVLGELAILCSMGSANRRGEGQEVADALSPYRPLSQIEPPALVDGGDVLTVGQRLFVGLSSRTNQEGVEALAKLVTPLGYEVTAVAVRDCLHLKTGCTALTPDTVLVNPNWVDASSLSPLRTVRVAADEPWAANVLSVGKQAIMPAQFPHTKATIESMGVEVHCVDISEFQKAEAGVTCLSILYSPK